LLDWRGGKAATSEAAAVLRGNVSAAEAFEESSSKWRSGTLSEECGWIGLRVIHRTYLFFFSKQRTV
jgi:hypothetical protein